MQVLSHILHAAKVLKYTYQLPENRSTKVPSIKKVLNNAHKYFPNSKLLLLKILGKTLLSILFSFKKF